MFHCPLCKTNCMDRLNRCGWTIQGQRWAPVVPVVLDHVQKVEVSAPEIVEENKECFESVNTIKKLSIPYMIECEGSNRSRIGRMHQTRRHKAGCCNIELYCAGASW